MVKNHENREILRFFPTLSASISESMGSSQVSLRTHVNVVCVNRSSKGHVNQEKGTVKITMQKLGLQNRDILLLHGGGMLHIYSV